MSRDVAETAVVAPEALRLWSTFLVHSSVGYDNVSQCLQIESLTLYFEELRNDFRLNLKCALMLIEVLNFQCVKTQRDFAQII